MTDVLSRKWKIGIVLLALFVRAIYFFLNYQAHDGNLVAAMKGDDGYYELSQNILLGRGFVSDVPPEPPINPNPLRPPLWPMLAALAEYIGGHWVVVAVLFIMGSLVPLLGARIVPLIVEHAGLRGEADVRRITQWVALMLVFEPYSVFLSTVMYSETSFTFFFLIGLYFLLAYIRAASWRRIVWAAVFLGLACLIKPTIQYAWVLVPAFVLTVELFRSGMRSAMMRTVLFQSVTFSLIFSAVLMPWIIRNYREFGVYGMSAQPAYNLYTYLVPTVRALRNNTSFAIEHRVVFAQPGFNDSNITLTTSDTYTKEAFHILKDYKKELVKNIFISGFTFFTHDGILTVLQYAGVIVENRLSKPALQLFLDSPRSFVVVMMTYATSPAALIIGMRLIWFMIALGFVAGVCVLLWGEKGKRYARLLGAQGFVLFLTLYFLVTTTINGLGVNARFRVPILTIIFTVSCIGLRRLYGAARLYLRGKFNSN